MVVIVLLVFQRSTHGFNAWIFSSPHPNGIRASFKYRTFDGSAHGMPAWMLKMMVLVQPLTNRLVNRFEPFSQRLPLPNGSGEIMLATKRCGLSYCVIPCCMTSLSG